MGQARLKMLDAGKPVQFDFGAPELYILKADRQGLGRGEDGAVNEALVKPRASKFTIATVIKSAFPNGMDRKEGKVWAAWLEVLDDDGTTQVEMAKSQVEWLRKHVGNDEVKVPPPIAQWREALLDYLDGLLVV